MADSLRLISSSGAEWMGVSIWRREGRGWKGPEKKNCYLRPGRQENKPSQNPSPTRAGGDTCEKVIPSDTLGVVPKLFTGFNCVIHAP